MSAKKDFVIVPFNLKLKVPKGRILYTAWTFLEMSLDSSAEFDIDAVIDGKVKMTSAEIAFQKVNLVRGCENLLPIDHALNLIRFLAPEEIADSVSDTIWRIQAAVDDEDLCDALDKKACDKVADYFYQNIWPIFEKKAEAAYQKEVKKRQQLERQRSFQEREVDARAKQAEIEKATRLLEVNGATVIFPKQGLPLPNATKATKKPAAKKR